VSAAALSLLGLGCFSVLALPRFDSGKSAHGIAGFLHQRYPGERFADLRVGILDYKQYSFLYYLNGVSTRVPAADARAFLDAAGPAVLIMPESRLEALDLRGPDRDGEVIWRRRTWTADKNRWEPVVVLGSAK
jgi:hypothetical protein